MMAENYEKLQGLLAAAKAGAEDVAAGIKNIDLRGRRDLLGNVKASDLLAAVKLKEIVDKDDKKKTMDTVKMVLIIIAAVAIIAVICYAIYRYLTPEVVDDYEGDMEDELDRDFFEDEDDDEI